jgi:hypothetical protein
MRSRLIGFVCAAISCAFIAVVGAATICSATVGTQSWSLLGTVAACGAVVGSVLSLLFPEPVNFYATWLVKVLIPG